MSVEEITALEEIVSKWEEESIPPVLRVPRYRKPMLKNAITSCGTAKPEDRARELMDTFKKSCVEFMDSLSEEQKQKIEELRPTVEKCWEANQSLQGLLLEPTLRAMLTKGWLYARNWDVAKAQKMIEDHIEWRKQYKQEETPFWPPPDKLVRGYDYDMLSSIYSGPPGERPEYWKKVLEDIHKAYADGWHKHDKEGRPVWFERTGAGNPKAMVRYMQAALVGNPLCGDDDWSDVIMRMHFVSNNIGGLLCAHNTLATGKIVSHITAVMDMQGLGMNHIYGPAMKLMEKRDRLDQANFPDALHRVYIVNAPTMIKVAWNIVKVWLDKKVQQKVIFLGKDAKEVLRREIGAENLPKFLGGDCECQGKDCDCVSPPTGDDPLTKDMPNCKVLSVGAGKHGAIREDVQPGEAWTWEFSSKPVDIGFCVGFQPEGKTGDDSIEKIVGYQRPNCILVSGMYVFKAKGTLVLKFDNTFSWMTGKEVVYRLEKSAAPPEVVEAVDSGVITEARPED